MENGNFRFFAANKNWNGKLPFVSFKRNGKRKFVFLGQQSINGNQWLLYMPMCPFMVTEAFLLRYFTYYTITSIENMARKSTPPLTVLFSLHLIDHSAEIAVNFIFCKFIQEMLFKLSKWCLIAEIWPL